jgi:hypothetical protein
VTTNQPKETTTMKKSIASVTAFATIMIAGSGGAALAMRPSDNVRPTLEPAATSCQETTITTTWWLPDGTVVQQVELS